MDLTALPVWAVLALTLLGAWGLGIMLGCVLGSTWRERHPSPLDPGIVGSADDDDEAPTNRYGRHAR